MLHSVGVTLCVLYGAGIPLIALYYLRKNRPRLHEEKVLRQWGFLYDGYDIRRVWFWELVILAR